MLPLSGHTEALTSTKVNINSLFQLSQAMDTMNTATVVCLTLTPIRFKKVESLMM